MAQRSAETKHLHRRSAESRTPPWKRVTALFSLGSLVILGGILLAAILGLTVIVLLFALERAIAG